MIEWCKNNLISIISQLKWSNMNSVQNAKETMQNTFVLLIKLNVNYVVYSYNFQIPQTFTRSERLELY